MSAVEDLQRRCNPRRRELQPEYLELAVLAKEVREEEKLRGEQKEGKRAPWCAICRGRRRTGRKDGAAGFAVAWHGHLGKDEMGAGEGEKEQRGFNRRGT